MHIQYKPYPLQSKQSLLNNNHNPIKITQTNKQQTQYTLMNFSFDSKCGCNFLKLRLVSIIVICIWLIGCSLSLSSASAPIINFTSLNHKLQTLSPDYLKQFVSIFTVQRIRQFNDKQAGQYLFLLGKMYIYNMLPQSVLINDNNLQSTQQNDINRKYGDLKYDTNSKLMAGYFYLKISAQVYQNGDAYYYLAVLEYMKISPIPLIKNNIKKLLKQLKKHNLSPQPMPTYLSSFMNSLSEESSVSELIKILAPLPQDMESHHLHNIQQNLYLASVLGQTPAKLSIAYMFKEGISTERNCSTALSYYLSVVKKNKVENFQFPSDYIDGGSFQKQLYAGVKADLKGYGEYDPTLLQGSSIFDQQTLEALEEQAMRYMTGEDGTTINQALSAKIWESIINKSKLARIMLGFMYLKGRGVQRNGKKARQLFQTEVKVSRVAKQTMIMMKYYGIGTNGDQKIKAKEMKEALSQMQEMYRDYQRKMIQADNNTINKLKQQQNKAPIVDSQKKGAKAGSEQNNNQKSGQQQQQDETQDQKSSSSSGSSNTVRGVKTNTFRTPMLKYLASSLVISGHIISQSSDKKYALFLLDEAAKQGNTLALVQMALQLIDGSDSSFDCDRAADYFAKQALSLAAFQNRIELAKKGIKMGHYMFSYIKYLQLVMVGYRNAFINTMYMLDVYAQELKKMLQIQQWNIVSIDNKNTNFNTKGKLASIGCWSIANVRKNGLYKMLLDQDIISDIGSVIIEMVVPVGDQHLFNNKVLQLLTTVQPSSNKNAEKTLNSAYPDIPSEMQEYITFPLLKILAIGIQKLDISILKFIKYKQSARTNASSPDIALLHTLANTAQQNPHISQSRFLLGRYYQHTNISGVALPVRQSRAMEEYTRAVKNKILAELIYVIEGGNIKGIEKIVNDGMWFLMAIMIVGVYMYWKRGKVLDAILNMEDLRERQAQQTQKQQEMKTNYSGQDNQSRMGENREKGKMQQIYQQKRPKFSEQQYQNIKVDHNLQKIKYLQTKKQEQIQNEKKYRRFEGTSEWMVGGPTNMYNQNKDGDGCIKIVSHAAPGFKQEQEIQQQKQKMHYQ